MGMGGWERFVLPGAGVSGVVGEDLEVRGQEQQPHEMVGSALWQGTRYDDGGPSFLDANGGSADEGRALVNGHCDPSSANADDAAAIDKKDEELENEDEEEEEEEDVVFVMGHEVGKTWSPERRT